MAKFKKGDHANPKGCPKGAHSTGRPSDWFREQCKKALERCKGVEFVADVASGKEFPQLATSEGEVIPLPPSLKDRQRAVEWLADRAHGKAGQTIDVNDTNPGRFILIVDKK